MAKVAAVPEQYGSLTTYLVLNDCSAAIDFYKKVFDATEHVRMEMPDGKIGHAELQIGDSILMLAEANETWRATSSLVVLYVEDCDAVFHRAMTAGADMLEAVSDKFYGDRAGSVRDPFGQRWSIMTHKEDLTPEEMEARLAKMRG